MDEARRQWQQLDAALGRAESGVLPVDALARGIRADHQALVAALPPAFDTVLQGLLDRLESAASFTDEACAVSQRDLLASLRLWSDKAAARLG